MYLNSKPSNIRSGYTIVEAMIAISLLMLGVAAAAALAMTMVDSEDINARAARGLNGKRTPFGFIIWA